MEIVRTTPGKIYARSNTNTAIKLLSFISIILIVMVVGICAIVIFGQSGAVNFFLDDSGNFYYSLDEENNATLEKYVPNAGITRYEIPAVASHGGQSYPLTQIGQNAFTNQASLTEVIIPNSVKIIAGDNDNQTGAFSGCIRLMKVDLGKGVTHLQNYAFKNCFSLKKITLPESILFVGSGTFMDNLALEEIEILCDGQIDAMCWQNCNQAKTLKLGNDIELDASKKRALAQLNNLSEFILDEDNDNYIVSQHCLLGKDGTNIVLGGKVDSETERVLPSVNHIEDWAFAQRYGNDEIWLSKEITTVGQNAFTVGVIYTDADDESQLTNWKTDLPVRLGAQKINFKRNLSVDDEEQVSAYIFKQGEKKADEEYEDYYLHTLDAMYYPKYQTLFGTMTVGHEFDDWGALDGTTCEAEYDDGSLAEADNTDLLALQTLLADDGEATLKLLNENLRRQFTLAFWEEYKSAYGKAEIVCQKSTQDKARIYEVKLAKTNLEKYLEVLRNPGVASKDILESTDWKTALNNVVDAINRLDRNDFEKDDGVWNYIDLLLMQARSGSASETTLKQLRLNYESLVAKVSNFDKLFSEVIPALDEADYTPESWANLQEKLADARQITKYNQSITDVRKALTKACKLSTDGGELVLNNLADYDDVLKLYVWLLVINDLDKTEYTVDSYDRLFLEAKIAVDVLDLDTDIMPTEKDVQKELALLDSAYRNLVSVNKKPDTSGFGKITMNTIPYFIVAAILFTGAVVAQGSAIALRKSQRAKNNE